MWRPPSPGNFGHEEEHQLSTETSQTADTNLLSTILKSLDDDKAENIVSIGLAGKTSIADHMVVASGRSQRHVGAVADHLVRGLKEAGFGTAKIEGMPACDWVLIDTGDVIVHIFRPEVREFYNIEKMWSADVPVEPVAAQA